VFLWLFIDNGIIPLLSLKKAAKGLTLAAQVIYGSFYDTGLGFPPSYIEY
jgi:hypothetical protein